MSFIRNVFKNTLQVLLATLLLFVILETVFYLFSFPQGASRFVEQIIIKESLSPKKPKGQFRIFTYGESTMYGAHYGAVSSPARWLEAYLKDFLPDQNIKVVKFARLGCGSHFVYDTFKQTLAYQPDIAIFYVGHNSFLPGNRKDQVKAEEDSFSGRLRSLMQESRFISAVYRWALWFKMKFKKNPPSDYPASYVIEKLPPQAKADDFIDRDESVYWENIAFTEENILNILALAESKGVHVLFLKPVSNLKDFAPTYSLNREALSPRELAKWDRLFADGKWEQTEGNLKKAMELYQQAYDIDSDYADLAFRLGQVHFMNRDFNQARRYFEEARDHDAFINRATSDMLRVFDELEKTKNIHLVNTEEILIPETEGEILGEPIIEDNVHFSLKGHFLVGLALAKEIAENNWIVPVEKWKFDRGRSYDEVAEQIGINQELLISAYLNSLLYFGNRLDNRIRFAKKILTLDPNQPQALRHLAWAYWLKGQQQEALSIYEKLDLADPEVLSEVFRLQPRIKKAFRTMRASSPALSV